jgi:signal transduction histidine kinase
MQPSEPVHEAPIQASKSIKAENTDLPTRPTRHRLVLPWVVLAVGIPASILLFSLIQDAVEDVARLRFERYASDAKHVIEARVRSYTDVLYGLQALFATQDSISRAQFRRYVESLDLKHRYPGFDVVNYAVHVSAKDKEYFEEAVRRDTSLDPRGYPEFAIKPPGTRPEHFVMVYVEPMAGFEYAFGLDLGANPGIADPQALAATMRFARDSGKLTASGLPIRVKGATEYIGLAMRLPVFRSGKPTGTVEQRRAAYLGSVGAGFNVANLMRGVLNEETAGYLRFRLYDVGSAGGKLPPGSAAKEWLLFDSNQLMQGAAARSARVNPDAVFTSALPMEVGGRIWEAHFSAPKHAIMGRVDALLPWLIFAGGLLSSALLFGVFYSLASSRSRAVEIANEITSDLRESEEGLRNSAEQLQAMSRRLVDAQESERRQISRELHDRVGQNLTALSINLDILKTQLAGNGNEAFCSRLNDAASLLEATTGTIENVMAELRPPMLDDYGLLPALQWYTNEFSSRTGIQMSVDGDEEMERLTQASEIALFRIVQEALNNAVKHAHARSIHITLERSSARFMMTVSDDGVGLNTALIPPERRRPGLGMVTMRERAQAIGGQFEIEAAAGRGTRVVVRIPH